MTAKMFPMIFFTTYVQLILWEEENKMGGIHIDSNLFEISKNYQNANDIPFDDVSPTLFVYCRHCIKYIKESNCYHYFSIIFLERIKRNNHGWKKHQLILYKVQNVKKGIPIYADISFVESNGLNIILISTLMTMSSLKWIITWTISSDNIRITLMLTNKLKR